MAALYLRAFERHIRIDRILMELGVQVEHLLLEDEPLFTCSVYPESSPFICEWALYGADGEWTSDFQVGFRDHYILRIVYHADSGKWEGEVNDVAAEKKGIRDARFDDDPTIMGIKAIFENTVAVGLTEQTALEMIEEAADSFLSFFREVERKQSENLPS